MRECRKDAKKNLRLLLFLNIKYNYNYFDLFIFNLQLRAFKNISVWLFHDMREFRTDEKKNLYRKVEVVTMFIIDTKEVI